MTAVDEPDATRARCSACGSESPVDASFCRSCGAPFVPVVEPAPDPEQLCPSCQAPVQPDHRFCRTCGHELSEASTGADETAPLLPATPAEEAPPPAASPPRAPRPRPSKRLVVTGACALALLAGAGVLFGVVLRHDESPARRQATDRAARLAQSTPAPAAETPTATPIALTPTPTATAEPPATLLPTGPASQFTDDVRSLLLRFHQAVADGRYRSAWNLLSARKQEKELRVDGYPTWRAAQASLSRYLDPSGIEVSVRSVDRQTGVALVRVTGMSWSKPGARCAEWAGLTWVKYENGEWRYDPGYSTTPQRKRAWASRYGQLLGTSC